MSFEMVRIAHVNLRIPSGGEPIAEAFWCGLLGFTRLQKPPGNAHPGMWFRHNDYEVHVSPDDDFAPVTRAHTAFVVEGLTELFNKLRSEGTKITVSKGSEDDVVACFAADPFGNRLEMVAPGAASMGT